MIRDQRNYGPMGGATSAGATLQKLVEAIVPLKVDLTSTGNGADQTEDTLISYSIPANTMGANGVQGFKIKAWGTLATNGDNKQVKLYFGTVSIATGVITDSNKNWFLELNVYRSGTNTQVIVGEGQRDTTSITPTVTTGTETETAAIVAKVTGQGTTANTANEVVAKALIVEAIEQKKIT